MQRRRRLRKGGGYSSAYLTLKKELREANLQSLLGGSSSFASSTNIDSDPLLSSFMFNPPSAANKSATPVTEGASATTKLSQKESLKRYLSLLTLLSSGKQSKKVCFSLGLWFVQRHSRRSTFRGRSREGEEERVCERFVLVNHAW